MGISLSDKLWGYPDVFLDVVFEDGLLFLVLENIGKQPAFDISCKFNKDIHGFYEDHIINQIALFTDLKFLAPSKKIRTFLSTSIDYFQNERPLVLKVVINFKNRKGKTFNNCVTHNLEVYRHIGYIHLDGPGDK